MTTLENELDYLLGRLCVEMGFCSLGDEHGKIARAEQWEAKAFALKVLEAEGFDHPEYEVAMVRLLAARFAKHFGRTFVRASDFKL